MSDQQVTTDVTRGPAVLRAAAASDIPILIDHRRRMMEEIWQVQSIDPTTLRAEAMSQAYEPYLRSRLTGERPARWCDGAVLAWLVEDDGQAAASLAISMMETPPRPRDACGRKALLHSVFVEPARRGRGHARRLVAESIEACRAAGIGRMELGASDAAKALYESFGFHVHGHQMRLDIRL